MSEMTDDERLELAKHGDRRAFDELVAPHLAKMKNLVRRMVGHPQDSEDITQDALVRAYTRLGTFRGESSLSTWLCAIATRVAIDHLATRRAQGDLKLALKEYVHETRNDEFWVQVKASSFDAREHIAFCFGCVSRSLPVEEQAALVLRDVLELSNDEAAHALDVTTSVLRHRLASARTAMQERYAGLCRLVSKEGVCYQCEGLRNVFPEEQRGPAVPVIEDATPDGALRKRLAVVRDADLDGPGHALHDFLWRAVSAYLAAR
jgi:RNA polymerase sigma-70 factor (ECF subfamily)